MRFTVFVFVVRGIKSYQNWFFMTKMQIVTKYIAGRGSAEPKRRFLVDGQPFGLTEL
jgi:hypothetical protein